MKEQQKPAESKEIIEETVDSISKISKETEPEV